MIVCLTFYYSLGKYTANFLRNLFLAVSRRLGLFLCFIIASFACLVIELTALFIHLCFPCMISPPGARAVTSLFMFTACRCWINVCWVNIIQVPSVDIFHSHNWYRKVINESPKVFLEILWILEKQLNVGIKPTLRNVIESWQPCSSSWRTRIVWAWGMMKLVWFGLESPARFVKARHLCSSCGDWK